MRRTAGSSAALGLGLALLGALVLLPFWWVFSGSIRAPREIIARVPTFWPRSFTLEHFERLLGTSAYPTYLANSVLVALGSTVLTLALAIPAAYAFYRLDLPGREALYRLMLVAYAFPSIVLLIPLFGILASFGLVDHRGALVIVNTAFALPFAIWMLRSFLTSIPAEIEEAAMMDGAPMRVIILRILLPLIAPGLASVAAFAFITSWTEYVFASVLILSDERRTLPVGFSGMIGQYQVDWGLLLAGAGLAVVPVVILFALVGRWFVAGLTDGAIK